MHSVPAEAAQRRRSSIQARPLLDVALVGPDERNGSAKQSQASGGECPLSGVQKSLLFDRNLVGSGRIGASRECRAFRERCGRSQARSMHLKSAVHSGLGWVPRMAKSAACGHSSWGLTSVSSVISNTISLRANGTKTPAAGTSYSSTLAIFDFDKSIDSRRKTPSIDDNLQIVGGHDWGFHFLHALG
jgi:hypothetical protein